MAVVNLRDRKFKRHRKNPRSWKWYKWRRLPFFYRKGGAGTLERDVITKGGK